MMYACGLEILIAGAFVYVCKKCKDFVQNR
jgi:hypothetical protein